MREREIIRELPAGYYLDNFCYLINFVHEHYLARLTPAEITWRETFLNLSPAAQKLYVRLILRRGPVFRVQKIHYEEVPDVPGAVVELCAFGLLGDCAALPCDEVLMALTKADLLALPVAAGMAKTSRKPELVAELAALGARPSEPMVTPLGQDVLAVYKLLFFGNLYQDFSEFVLSDMGFTPYENYSVDPSSNWLSERHFVDMTLHLHALSDLSYELIEAGDADDLLQLLPLLELQLEHPRLQARYDKIVNRIARQLERYGRYEAAQTLFLRSTTPPARERRARILSGLGNHQAASDLCHAIHEDPANEQEAEFALRFLKKLRKHCEVKVNEDEFSWLNAKPVTQEISITGDPEMRVEALVVNWFEEQGRHAIYVENSLFNSLFGLTFWDIIFQQADNAFYNPFQRGPMDLFSAEFQQTRARQIEDRMQVIADPVGWQALLQSTYADKFPRANHFVNWQWPQPEVLVAAASKMPGEAVQQIFRRMLSDLKNHRSGFPDLIVIDDDRCELVEVKGPGDKLQEHQRRWLRFFDDINFPASVLNVVFADQA